MVSTPEKIIEKSNIIANEAAICKMMVINQPTRRRMNLTTFMLASWISYFISCKVILHSFPVYDPGKVNCEPLHAERRHTPQRINRRAGIRLNLE
jgi:hypothetical protein